MPFKVSPGVNVSEFSYGLVANGVSTSGGALCGSSSWGPTNEIKTISSIKDLASYFGAPTNDTYETFFTGYDFLSYSDNLKFVRVVGDKARNAISGARGAGLTLDVVTLNGEVSSVTVNAKGTGYVIGDLVEVGGDFLSHAVLRVSDISSGGLVEGLALLDNGSGYVDGTAVAAANITSFKIGNTEEFEASNNLPEVLAKFPSVKGNTLLLSAVRAAEFDNWEYKARFGIAPKATVETFKVTGKQKAFTMSKALPEDGVVSIDGLIVESGVDPFTYSASSTSLTINTESETFVLDSDTSVDLINASGIPTNSAKVDVDGAVLTEYTGETAIVPKGSYKIVDNKVYLGSNRAAFSGNGKTKVFTLVGVDATADAKVTVDGVDFTVVSIAPVAGEVQVAYSASNTTLTFHVDDTPGIGVANIVVLYGFETGTLTVEYGFPQSVVKVFSNQTEVHAIVVDIDGSFTGGEKNFTLERYPNLSLIEGTKSFDGSNTYYVDAINLRSEFVRIGTPFTQFEDKRLSGGVSDDKFGEYEGVTPGKLQSGYSLFRSPEDVEFRHLISGAADTATNIYLISVIAESRKDCVVYISPKLTDVLFNRGNEVESVKTDYFNYPKTSYGHYDTNWKYSYDRWNDKYRWVPCNGASAGCYAATHDEFDPWISAAGLQRGIIRNALKLAWNPNQTDRDELYPYGINPITKFKDDGIVLFGDKTMQSEPNAFDSMSVRFLFIVLELMIARASRFYLFDQNDRFTWNRFKNMVIPVLRDAKGRRGVEEYVVKADEDNNPRAKRAQKIFTGDIYIRPVYSINFIQLNFNAVHGDVTFEEIQSDLQSI